MNDFFNIEPTVDKDGKPIMVRCRRPSYFTMQELRDRWEEMRKDCNQEEL